VFLTQGFGRCAASTLGSAITRFQRFSPSSFSWGDSRPEPAITRFQRFLPCSFSLGIHAPNLFHALSALFALFLFFGDSHTEPAITRFQRLNPGLLSVHRYGGG
jgi:hypothetical protein